jgi:polyferredoxin
MEISSCCSASIENGRCMDCGEMCDVVSSKIEKEIKNINKDKKNEKIRTNKNK